MDRPSFFALVALLSAAILAWLVGPLAHIGAAYLPFVATVILVTAAAGAGWGLVAFALGAALPFLPGLTAVAPVGQDPASRYTLTLYALAALPACVVMAEARRRAQRLQVELRLLEDHFECVAEALLTTDGGARVLRMNRSAERLTGWRAAEARGKPLAQVLHFADRDASSPNPAAARLAGDIVGPVAETLLASDGSERPVQAIVTADGHGGQLIELRDLTDAQRTERELRLLLDEIWTSNRHKDAAIAALSGAREVHEPPAHVVTPEPPVVQSPAPEAHGDPDTQPAQTEDLESSSGQRVLMLCADDDSAFARSMLLGLAGYDVQTANTADEALRRVAQFAPEVVLVDVEHVDGVGMAQALRRRVPGLLLVALTRAGALPNAPQLAAAGYTTALSKTEPLALKRWLAGPRAA